VRRTCAHAESNGDCSVDCIGAWSISSSRGSTLIFGKDVKVLFLASGITLMSAQAFAQTPDSVPTTLARTQGASVLDASLATPIGHEVNASVGGYTYLEPGGQSISIQGVKLGGEYTATLPLSRRRLWFAQADVRGTIGNVTYTGWCSPFLITPNKPSLNGYELNVGDASPCSETGDKDWYLEARALAGKDLIGPRWGVSPYTGLGFRHLSNGTTGTAGYRTDNYLYLPVGMTARTKVASGGALSFNMEFDLLIHGWQETRDSELSVGDVPATTTAPTFTIDSFTDISFSQSRGWGLRASAKYQVTKHWSVEPYYAYWNVSASPVKDETVTFTVNHVTAQEQLGAYEPFNVTHEFGVKLGFHFCSLRRLECSA
jgi:hypothetical protein